MSNFIESANRIIAIILRRKNMINYEQYKNLKELNMENKIDEVKALVVDKQPLNPLIANDSDTIKNRLEAFKLVGKTIKQSLVKGINEDYATIPGTTKLTLLQPGALKICQLFGLIRTFDKEEIGSDGTITIKCSIWNNDKKIAESYGCESIGKQRSYGWEKNKALKIAQKRAMVGAVIQVANLTSIFTQDMEDIATPNIEKMSEEDKQELSIFTDTDKYAWPLYDLAQKAFKLPNKKISVARAVDMWNANHLDNRLNTLRDLKIKDYEEFKTMINNLISNRDSETGTFKYKEIE